MTIQNPIEAVGDIHTEPIHLNLPSSESSQSESSMSDLNKPIAHAKVEMERLKQCPAFEFEIKDLGSLKFFLEMEIARSKKGIAVSQRKFVLDLLKETVISGCRLAETPIDPIQKLGDNKGDPVNTSRYQKLVGKLNNLSHRRPDIAFAIGSRHQDTALVARSSVDRAIAHVIFEMMWLKWVLEELRRPMTMPMKLYSDNKAAISIATLVGGVALGLANPSLGCLADRFYLSKFSTFGVFVISGLTLNTEEIVAAAGAWPVGLFGLDLMTKQTIDKGHVSDGLYILDAWVPRSVACSGVVSPFEAHCRLGHPSLPVLKKLCPQFHDISSVDCESCHFAKHHRSSLSPRVNKRVESAFELVHSDVWGSCPVLSKSGFIYFVTFVDDFSRMIGIYFMKNRSEVFAHFSAFCAEINTQFNVHVHILRSDNAKEYMSGSFQNYMNQHGILHQSSWTDTPAQNGVAERKNRHFLETGRALLFQMKVPKPFWADAISTACFLINRMPSTVLNGDVPYSVLFPTKPLFPVEPRIFGSTCFVRDVRPHLTKLDPKALKCVFLGYSRLQKGYRCYSPDLHRYLVSTDVVFSEHSPFFSSKFHSSSKGEDDDRLMYEIFPSVPIEPAISEDRTREDGLSVPVSVPVEPSNAIDGANSGVAQSEDVNGLGEQAIIPSAPVKPPIVQVYSRMREHHDTCPAPAPSSSDPPPNDLDLPIGLRKDADWAGSKLDRKSTTGYCVFVGGNLVSWKKISLKPPLPAKLWCDNQAARHIASNPVYHERTKHIEGSILFLTPFFSRIILQLQLRPQEFVTGLAIFSCMPTTLLSGVTLTRIAGGNAALALAMTVMSNMLGIFVVPLSISKFIAAGVGVSVPAKQLFKSLVLTLLVPLILGKVLRESFKGLADFADRNRKRLSLTSALLLALVPLIQVSRSRSLLLMVRPAVFLVAVVSGILLHLILLAFNALLIQSLSAVSGGGNSIFAQKQNARALLLVASQKTLPVMVAVVEQLGGAFGEPGLLVLPCVAAHFNQTIIDSFLVSSWLQKDDCPATQRPSET
ncbi:hypothetical protein RJ640_001406 [Escallonia rubra]|uniref:Probable sodium/metabolite cotransporter BASS4, chloroplastic n=1 Tax=Escallonia rubra TaxID=112253 RepID=A0AA88QPS0_9ASTE|nr:hypothetical protein RJ640_001406 [Escallonia rubra]